MATPNSLKDSVIQSNGHEEPTPEVSTSVIADAPAGVAGQTAPIPLQTGRGANQGWWQRLSLRTKATLLALVIGTAPVLVIGSIAYGFAGQALQKNAIASQKVRTTALVDKVNRFMLERYNDINLLAGASILGNVKVSQNLNLKEKQDLLDKYLLTYRVYDSIAMYDLKGNLLVASSGVKASQNISDRPYFQDTLQVKSPTISQPDQSVVTKKTSIFFAAPIRDAQTGEMIALIRSRMPIEAIDKVIRKDFGEGEEYNIVDASGKAFISVQAEDLGKPLAEIFPDTAPLVKANQEGFVFSLDTTSGEELSIDYVPFARVAEMPSLRWAVMTGIDSTVFRAPEQELALLLALGAGAVAISVAALATYLAGRATRPIVASAEAVEKIGQGKLDTRIAIQGQDELAVLGSNINLMAEQIQDLITQQEAAAQAQMSAQSEVTRQQLESADQERQRSEALQKELMELLEDVGGASEGDLTVRAAVSAGEIGIVADFFNSIVESMGEIVTQVKDATSQVNVSLGEDEAAMTQLATDSRRQAKKIQRMVDFVEQMASSIQSVANNASQAADVARHASITAETGGQAMDQTVEAILELQDTVAETTEQVKQLGKASQKISAVISLINQIALKTNVLAVNASIEAARAGEEGQGFAVVAAEVGTLAAQSAEATKEVERLVKAIQLETRRVVDAMELGTTRVEKGTQRVEKAKQSLEQIIEESRQIDQLVQSISDSTVSQAKTSEMVKNFMQDVAKTSEKTSNFSLQVVTSLQETVEIAQHLKSSVDTFQVNAQV